MLVASDWNGQDLIGEWVASKKLDGVRALSDGVTVKSRKNKPLYGLDNLADKFADAEIYCGSFKETLTVVRSHNERSVRIDEIFHLDLLDSRLVLLNLIDPTAQQITTIMNSVINPGHIDGIVMRQGNSWIKCKPIKTMELRVIGIQAGNGKHIGRMGALETIRGKVGTGFSDREREDLMNCFGKFIEVSYLELTTEGKLRHPRFVRLRPDKD